MKKSIKQWCKEHDISWYGQGVIGSIRYDWKLVLAPGRSAIFSSIIESDSPEVRSTKKRNILVFPNINTKSKNGISQSRFLELIQWVNEEIDRASI